MPRLARLDIVGLLQHVMVRGIEQRNIFWDDLDRQHFLDRFVTLLAETKVRCFAWSLLSNHFHLLLMPTSRHLSCFMSRLLTGYAQSFNRRHNRSGHLFQNRYKSIVCEEEPYLLELVRYIHLNPLRAGLVANLDELDRYPWCGHAILMGNGDLEMQETNSILERFSQTITTARRNYRQFLQDGIPKGHREDLVGGGLKRSQGERTNSDYESFDERVLGCGDFVDGLKQEILMRDKMKSTVTLVHLVNTISAILSLDPDSVKMPSKNQALATARGIISYLALFELNFTGYEVGHLLHLGSSGVSLAARRGERLLKTNLNLMNQIFTLLAK